MSLLILGKRTAQAGASSDGHGFPNSGCSSVCCSRPLLVLAPTLNFNEQGRRVTRTSNVRLAASDDGASHSGTLVPVLGMAGFRQKRSKSANFLFCLTSNSRLALKPGFTRSSLKPCQWSYSSRSSNLKELK